MSPFDSVRRPSVKRKPATSNPVSNLVKLTTLGILGFGLVIASGSGSVTPGRTLEDVVTSFVAIETESNCAGTGCIQVIAGATEDGSIFTQSGRFIVGPLESPICSLTESGALQGSCAWEGNTISNITLPDPITAQTLSGAKIIGAGGNFEVSSTGALTMNDRQYVWPTGTGDCETASGCMLTLSGSNLNELIWSKTAAAAGGGGGGWTMLGSATAQSTARGASSTSEIFFTDTGYEQTIPAGSLAAGDVVKVDVAGLWSSISTSYNPTMRLYIDDGTTNTEVFSQLMTVTGAETNDFMGFQSNIVFRTVGASGTAYTSTSFEASGNTSTKNNVVLQSDTGIDTTAEITIKVSVQFAISHASNNVRLQTMNSYHNAL